MHIFTYISLSKDSTFNTVNRSRCVTGSAKLRSHCQISVVVQHSSLPWIDRSTWRRSVPSPLLKEWPIRDVNLTLRPCSLVMILIKAVPVPSPSIACTQVRQNVSEPSHHPWRKKKRIKITTSRNKSRTLKSSSKIKFRSSLHSRK